MSVPDDPTLLNVWRQSYHDLENECPWPGPRPLSLEQDSKERWRFVGRSGDIRRFLQMVDEHSLIVFHGKTGSGKSTMLDVGLRTVLRKAGYAPLICGKWQSIETPTTPEEYIETQTTPEEYIAAVLRSTGRLVPEVIERLEQGVALTKALDEVYKGRAVLILDQFEELIRYQRGSFLELATWLLDVNAARRTRIVLSMRSEYIYELADLMRAARPFSTAYFEIGPVSADDDILAVITGPNRRRHAIEGGAASLLLERWKELDPESAERSLLYLHAVLYALYWVAHDRGSTVVDRADIETLEGSVAQRARTEHPGTSLFTAGFDRTIVEKLRLCETAAASLGHAVGGVLIASVKEQIRTSVGHLSSGGYKLEREAWDLFRLTAERELELLSDSTHTPAELTSPVRDRGTMRRSSARRLLQGTVGGRGGLDPLAASRAELMQRADVPIPAASASDDDAALAALGVRPVPWRADPNDATAGAMLGCAPWEVLVEEVRAFAFALEWLTEASVIRVSAPRGQVMATLIHDGFGIALEHWSAVRRLEPSVAIASLTAFEGERWDHWGEHPWPELEGGDGWRHLVNLRWRGGDITAAFHRVIFVNCDFRRARFLECTFEAVTFVNCLLDGAVFERCTVVGASPAHTAEIPEYIKAARHDAARGRERAADSLPAFVIDVSETTMADINHYRGTAVPGTRLYSPTSGVAAVPWDGPLTSVTDWSPAEGGVAMYGGRLSSLMIRGGDFSNGSMTFAHIAGSSLDLVEQATAAVTLSWSVVLGLSVSNRVGAADRAKVTINATECVLANTWFGPDLAGTVELDVCQVFSLTNVSDNDWFAVTLNDSAYGHIFRADSVSGRAMTVEQGDGLGDTVSRLVEASRRMAFRSNPGQVELERRAARLIAKGSQPA